MSVNFNIFDTQVGDRVLNSSAISNIIQPNPRGTRYSSLFGVVGDRQTDDTANVQSFMDYITSGGYEGILEGQALITAPITIPQSYLWTLRGSSLGTSQLYQATDNTPILQFTGANHSFKISDMFFNWPASPVQDSSKTNSVAIQFLNNYSRYNFQIERCQFGHGFRAISNDPVNSAITWGMTVRDCWHYPNMSGSFCWLGQAVSNGQPNLRFENIYLQGNTVAQTEPLIYINACDGFSLDNIEANDVLNGGKVLFCASSCGNIGSIKIERGSWSSGAPILHFQNAEVAADYIEIATIQVPDTAYGILLDGASSHFSLGSSSFSTSGTLAGKFYLVKGTANGRQISARLKYQPYNLITQAGCYLTDVQNTTASDCVTVFDWQQPWQPTTSGDANTTWQIGVNPPNILYATQLTDNRTITLSDDVAGDSNLFNGFILRIRRDATVPGAYTLTVLNSASAQLYQFASSTNGWVNLMWHKAGWRILEAGT